MYSGFYFSKNIHAFILFMLAIYLFLRKYLVNQ